VPVPASDGFFNWQGDTLSWRPFDAHAAGVPARRAIDVRPGWVVTEVSVVGRNVRAAWQASEGTHVPIRRYGAPPSQIIESQNVAVVLYDAASGRRVRDFFESGDAYGVVGDMAMPEWSTEWLGRCRDVQGSLDAGTDWRFDAFGSLRATRCGPGGARTTTAWFDLDIAPRNVGARVQSSGWDLATRVDGGLAAALEDRQVRAFDVDGRRELGQVALRPSQRVTWLDVLGEQRLLLVETDDGESSTGQPVLTAWSMR
jgi:hypothetical protein